MPSDRYSSLHSTVPFAALLILALALQSTTSSDTYTSPQFTAEPIGVIAAPGRPATLQCAVTGEPPPSVAWFREGGGEVAIGDRVTVDSGTGELTISSVELSDTGRYYCVASNAVGSVRSLSTSLDLAVFNTAGLSPESLVSKRVSDRQSIVLPCTVPTSLPPASIQWEHNGALLDLSSFTSGRMGITLAGDLIISSVQTSTDLGRYLCYATNDVLGPDSQILTTEYLLIGGDDTLPLAVPTEFETTPTSQTVLVGDSAHFDCFTTGTPVAEVRWTKDGSQISPDSHLTLTQSQRVLTISPVEEGDEGSYVCEATVPSTGSTAVSTPATLTVAVPPTIVMPFPAVAADVTEEVLLMCEVEASDDGSNIEWEWRVNSSEVVTSANIFYDRSGLISRLQIDSVGEEDRGVYQCLASLVVAGGNLRQAAANERLSVILTPPILTSQPLSDQLVFEGATISLPCVASGSPPPQFTWIRGGGMSVNLQDVRLSIPPEGSGDGTLTITGAVVADSSPYRCQATNTAGTDVSTTTQLRVLKPSLLDRQPEQLLGSSQSDVYTTDHGNTVSIPCSVTRDDSTTIIYRWYRDGTVVESIPGPGVGTLVLMGVAEEDRGRYECVVVITASGVGGQPLEETIGAITIGVGDPPTNPSPPTSPFVSTVTTHNLTLHWTPPTFHGNLPLTGYVVELQLLGNPLCLQVEPEWDEHQTAQDSSAVELVVSDLVPYQQYQVRIRATNSAYQSEPSSETEPIWTQSDVPSAPPSNVTAITGGLQEILVSWQPPADCLSYGGILTDYTVSYKISSETTYVLRMVGSNQTSLTLTSLRSHTTYTITVSAHTAQGAGPISDMVEATTRECSAPSPPTNLQTVTVNSTAALISWTPPTDPDDLYIITWCHGNKNTDSEVLRGHNSTLVTGLEPGRECVVTVTVNNVCVTTEAVNISVTTPTEGDSGATILSQPWFIAVVATVVAALLMIVTVVAVCLLCVCCRHQKEKIYITSRRSGSSLSGASTAFTEYQQKHKGVARASGITVHSEPPPQRRSTDYADLSSYNSHLSSATPSISSYQRNMVDGQNGVPPHHNGDQRPPAYPPHMNLTSQPDTMIQLPGPPPENFPPGVISHSEGKNPFFRGISSGHESTDSWSGAESYRDHMTSHMTSDIDHPVSLHSGGEVPSVTGSGAPPGGWRAGSGRGTAGNVRSDWASVPTNQLSPVHEHQVMDSHAHHQNRNQTETTLQNFNQHRSQPLLAHSPSPPPLPTSLPPPLSSLPEHAHSMDHMLNQPPPEQLRMELRHGRMDVGPMSHSHTQFQNHIPQPGMQNGFSQPLINVRPRSASPEYAEPRHVIRKHGTRHNSKQQQQQQQQQQQMLVVPPKTKPKRFGGSKKKQHSLDLLSPPQLADKKTSQLTPAVTLMATETANSTQLSRSTSDHMQHPPPPSMQPHSMSVEQECARTAVHPQPQHNDLREVLTQWKTQQENQERIRGSGERGNYGQENLSHNGYPNAMGLKVMSSGPTQDTSGLGSSLSHPSHNDHWTPSPQGGFVNHIQNSETPIVKNAPPIFTTPPTSSHAHVPTARDHHGSRGHSRKNHELENIYQSDPRKPQRRKGHVPGAIWKQMPMRSHIESSSSSESLSDSSSDDNASLTSEYV